MLLKPIPLAVQADMIFQELVQDLNGLSSGIVILHIRNSLVGTFGVRHAVQLQNVAAATGDGKAVLNEQSIDCFRELAVHLLKHKQSWTRGEITFRFSFSGQKLMVRSNFVEEQPSYS